MKFYYVANARIPTDKAHGTAIVKMCEALAKKGLEVQLVVPKRVNPITEDPYSYYAIKRNFKIIELPVLDLMSWLGKLGFFLEAISFAIIASIYCLLKEGVIYGRDEISLSILALCGKKVVWESHTAKRRIFSRILIPRVKALVVISNGLREYYANFGIKQNRILVAPSGVDVEMFDIDLTKEEARKEAGLPLNKNIVMYTGHLYSWKGVDTLKDACKFFKDEADLVVVSDKKHSEIPIFLRAADVLVLPNTQQEEIAKLHTSPMKLFEYMASGRAIVASNVPALREILDESTAFFFKPDEPQHLAEIIRYVLVHKEEAAVKASKARQEVFKYSWERRAERIIDFIGKK